MELTPAVVDLPRDLNVASVERLAVALDAAFDSEAPVVVLRGADADDYCLGLAIGRSTTDRGATHAFSTVLATMHHAPKPIIAAVDGRAIGGGMGLACACDWVVATDRAAFALPELLWGLVPAIIWPVITDRMPPHTARQWTITAHSRSAADGFSAGVVDEVVPVERLERAVGHAVKRLARLDGTALRRLRAWARDSRQRGLAEAVHMGADMTAAMMTDPRVRQRWDAFLEGDAPWSA